MHALAFIVENVKCNCNIKRELKNFVMSEKEENYIGVNGEEQIKKKTIKLCERCIWCVEA